jgi:putative ABC transport system permease protein
MLKRLSFALSYAFRNMHRDRQRTAFALFSIAAGVATVVALRMLGLMLTDALTSNVQAFLRADVVVEANGNSLFHISGITPNSTRDLAPFSTRNIPAIDKWATQNKVEITYAFTGELMQAALVRDGLAGRPGFIMANFIDPKVYPFYEVIKAEEPAGVPLAALFTAPDQVVVGRRMADQLGLHIGDQIRIGTASNLQTVIGIVADTSQSNFVNPLNLMFSFVYIDRAYVQQFGLEAGAADTAFLRIPADQDPEVIANRVRDELPRPMNRRGWKTQNVKLILANNTLIADAISRLFLLSSLVGLIIGGVGIINTMLVAVNRRSAEIAVLKTLGLKGRSIMLLFLVEAILLGILGSVLGLGLGLLLSTIAHTMGEQAFGIALPWRYSSDPLLLGMGFGILITGLFSLLPTMMAGQVRPNLVLRSGNIPLARAGYIPLILSLGLLIFSIGSIVDAIVGNPLSQFGGFIRRTLNQLPIPPGMFGTVLTFIGLGILMLIMWIVVWLLGKLPSFRNPNLRLAIRGLTLHRQRTALSMMALVIGMTALSGTLIMARSINMLLYTSVSQPLGGNVVILPLVPVTDTLARNHLSTESSVTGYRDIRLDGSELLAINNDYSFKDKLIIPGDTLSEFNVGQLNLLVGMNEYGNPSRPKLAEGRFLDSSDVGKLHIVIPYRAELAAIGVTVGSTFTYQTEYGRQTFEVVGVVLPDLSASFIPFSLTSTSVQAPIDVIQKNLPFDLIVANVDPKGVNEVMAEIGTVPGLFVFDVGVFDTIINRLLSQMAAIPLLVAGLSLFAAAILIASTVSLATMERRRQIGILKTLGVKRSQALNQLLIENGIIGAVGGLISLLPTMLILKLVPLLTWGVVEMPIPVDLIVLMLALSVTITLLATLVTAWSASTEKPLTVLRYE